MVLRIMYALILAARPYLLSGTLRPRNALCPLSPAEDQCPGRLHRPAPRGQHREDAGTPLTRASRRLCFSLVTIHTFAAGRVDKGRVDKSVRPGREYGRRSFISCVDAARRRPPRPASGQGG